MIFQAGLIPLIFSKNVKWWKLMNKERITITNNLEMKYERKRYAVLSAAIVFFVLVTFNLLVPCMRSIPDEMGAMAFAADLAGYDWNYVLTHPAKYYGNSMVFIMLPFFKLIKNPLFLYQCLLGIGAFFHSIPAYIACRIIQKYYVITDKISLIVGIGIISALFTPTRATNIDNEPVLILVCWLLIYLIILLQHEEKKKIQNTYSFFCAALLVFAYLSHTRAILYSGVFFIILIIYRICTKKNLVKISIFSGTYIVLFIIAINITERLKQLLFTNNSLEMVKNTPEELATSISTNMQSVFSVVGIQSFFDLFFSNLWISFVFGFGIIVFTFWNLTKVGKEKIACIIKKQNVSEKDLFFSELFCIIGFLISLIGVCIVWLPNAMSVHTEGANLSRGHFYLRYYGNYIAPLILFFLIRRSRAKEKKFSKKIIYLSLITVVISAGYSVLSYLGITTINYQYNIDWFYYFAPFSGMLNSWPNTIHTLSYFACATLFSMLIFLALVCVAKLNQKKVILLLIVLLIWYYGYGVTRFDRPYSISGNYYGSVNSFYSLYKDDSCILEGIDKIYYYNPIYGPAYIVQFMFPEYPVITDLESMESNGNVLLSSQEITDEMVLENYVYVQLDENEFLYVKDKNIEDKLKSKGYEIYNYNE